MPRLSRRRFVFGASAAGLALASGGLLTSCQRQVPLGVEPPRKQVRLGFLALTSAEDNAVHLAALRAGLRDLGYVEGLQLTIEERFGDGREEWLDELAADLVRQRVDVLVTASTQATLAAMHTTRSVPIVFTNSGDPLGAGLVTSLARPGGNLTGLTSLNRELAGKRLELLKTAAPKINRVAVLWADAAEGDVNATRAAAYWLGLRPEVFRVSRLDDLPACLQAARDARVNALVTVSTALLNSASTAIASFASANRLPSISEQPEYAGAGGLLAYGANLSALSYRAASYVDKILSGANPGDLPVERAERFELTINLRTAQALNLVLPQPLLLQATEVVS